jgi:hypothetical protein
VWSGASFPTYPPQAMGRLWFDRVERNAATVASRNPPRGITCTTVGQKMAAGSISTRAVLSASPAVSAATRYPSVNSFTVSSSGALTALSGPLQTASANGMVMAVGAAPKHGD